MVRQGALWRDVRVVTETGSTNTDLLADASDGAPEGIVLAAESQTAGRGRLGRRWSSQPLAALTFSVLLRDAEDGCRCSPGLLSPRRSGQGPGWMPA